METSTPGPGEALFWSCSARGFVSLPNTTSLDLSDGILFPEYRCDTFIDCDNWSDESGCSPSIVVAFWVYSGITAFLGALLLMLMVWVWRYRKHRVIKKSSPTFLLCVLAGAGMGYAALLPWIGYPNTANCSFRAWLLGLAFVFGWGSLFAKTYRVHKIFNNKNLTRVSKVTDKDMFLIVLVLLIIEVSLFGIWAIVDAWHAAESNINGVLHMDCTAAHRFVFYSFIFGYKAILLVWGTYLAWKTRKVPDEFNESRYIAISIFVWLALAVVVFPILFLPVLSNDRLTAFCVRSTALLFAISIVVGFLFLPKIFSIKSLNKRAGEQAANAAYPMRGGQVDKYRTKYLSEEELATPASPGAGTTSSVTNTNTNSTGSPAPLTKGAVSSSSDLMGLPVVPRNASATPDVQMHTLGNGHSKPALPSLPSRSPDSGTLPSPAVLPTLIRQRSRPTNERLFPAQASPRLPRITSDTRLPEPPAPPVFPRNLSRHGGSTGTSRGPGDSV